MHSTTKLSIHQITPYVRYVQKYFVPRSAEAAPVMQIAYDHRLFLVHKGIGYLELENHRHPLRKGDLFLLQSGTPYAFTFAPGSQLVLLGCNFDYTRQFSRYTYPVPPVFNVKKFKPERVLEQVEIEEYPEFSHPILLHHMYDLEITLKKMLKEYQKDLIHSDIALTAMMQEILVSVMRNLSGSASVKDAATPSKIQDVLNYIHEHYSEPISNEHIGQLFNYHPNYLNKLMVQNVGQSLHKYIISYRIIQAIDRLYSSDDPISVIAAKCGFNDVGHFNRIFRQRTGCAPSDYRTGNK